MLSRDVHRYLELQRSIGFKFRIQGSLLKNFMAFAERPGDRFVQRSRAIEWAGHAPSAPQRYNRLATVRRCTLALHAEDARHRDLSHSVESTWSVSVNDEAFFTPRA